MPHSELRGEPVKSPGDTFFCILLAAAGLLAVTIFAGCGGASAEQIQLLRSEVFSLKQDQRQLQHEVTALDSLIRLRVQSLDGFNADFSADVRSINQRLEQIEQRLSDSEERLTRLTSTVQTAAPSGGSAGGQAQKEPSARDLFDLDYKDFTSSNYQIAIEGFADFLQHHPDSPLAPEAYLYIGNSYQALNKYEIAVSSYTAILEKYPESPLNPDALYKIGDSLIKLGDVSRGETYFQNLIQKYPDANAARLARGRLKP